MLLLIPEPTGQSGSSLRETLPALPASPPVYVWELAAPTSRRGARRAEPESDRRWAHLRFLLRQAEAVLLEVLPPPAVLVTLLESGRPCLAPDLPALREHLGPGALYLSDWNAAAVAHARERLHQDPTEAEALTRKARAHARRLRRRVPVPEGLPAQGAERFPPQHRVTPASGWFPPVTPRRPGRGQARQGVLVLVLTREEAGLAETFAFLDAAAATVPLHRVLVLMGNVQELAGDLRSRWGVPVEVVCAPGPGQTAALQAGLERRHPSDGAVFWLEAGLALSDPPALERWSELLREEHWAGIAPGGVISLAREGPAPESPAEALEPWGRPGVLWDLRWFDAVGGLHPSLPPDAALIDLGYRLQQAAQTMAVDEAVRVQRATAHGSGPPHGRCAAAS